MPLGTKSSWERETLVTACTKSNSLARDGLVTVGMDLLTSTWRFSICSPIHQTKQNKHTHTDTTGIGYQANHTIVQTSGIVHSVVNAMQVLLCLHKYNPGVLPYHGCSATNNAYTHPKNSTGSYRVK